MMYKNLTEQTIKEIKAAHVTPADVAHHMLEIWESKIRPKLRQKPKSKTAADKPLSLSPKRKDALNWLSRYVLDSSLALWSEYIDLIADNDAWLEEVQRGGIDWAIEPMNYQMVLADARPGGCPGASDVGSDDAAASPIPTNNQ